MPWALARFLLAAAFLRAAAVRDRIAELAQQTGGLLALRLSP